MAKTWIRAWALQTLAIAAQPFWNASRWAIALVLLAITTPAEARSPALNFAPPPATTTPTRPQAPIDFKLPIEMAQASIVQGTQIILNGQKLNANWGQWQSDGQSAIELSDTALTQLFGFDLSNTANPKQQPIQWFSSSAILPARLSSPVRYLDIKDFAQKNGWRLQANGDVLEITTPPANVLGIQQEHQTSSNATNLVDRIVIDLDRPAPWQVDPQSQELLITLNAQISSSLLQAFKPNPASRIRSLKIETNQNRTILRLGLPLNFRPRITTSGNPNRLVIEVGNHFLSEKDILWANGLRWRQQYMNLGTTQFPVFILEVNPRQTGLRLRPILPNASIAGTAPLVQMAQRTSTTGAINGGFFNRNNQLPLGAIRTENRWLSGAILNRGAVAWDDNGNWRFDRLVLQETVTLPSGQRFPLNAFNSAYIQAGIARYTIEWGSTYTTLSDNEILMTVQNNQIVNQQTIATAGTSAPIPPTGYLLVFRSNRTAANSFPVGTTIQLQSALTPTDFNSYPYVIGGGPLLVQNGQIVLNGKLENFSDAFIQESAARSAIGQTADGKLLIVAVQNPTPRVGASLSNMADIMRQLGATNALNLDGGSSTTLYLGGQILDRPSRSSARVHNGIGIFLQP